MKLQRFLYASFIGYGCLIFCLILLSLWGHNFFIFRLDNEHRVFYLAVLSVLGVLTTAYWFAVLFFYKRYLLKRQAETKLILNRFQLALEASGEGVWDYSFNDVGKVYFSAEYCANLGFTREEFGCTAQAWRDRLMPEEADSVYQGAMSFISESEGRYDNTYRMLHRDNSYRWIRSRGHLIKNEHGQPLRFIGIARDITEKYAAKVRLQQAEAVFESTREAVLISDHSNRIVYVNPSFTRITGYSEQEVIGKMPNILKSDRHSSAFHQGKWIDLNEKGAISNSECNT